MKQKKMKIGNGLNKLVYGRDENPTDAVKVPLEDLKALCNEGELLCVELLRQMMGYGFDYYGTFIRTFALTQMVAYLKVFAEEKGFDAMAMFEAMMPKFTREAQQMLEEIKAEDRQQKKINFKILDLNNSADVKEFKKIMKNLKDE